ncbi:amino acid adenylation enzyme/thioester reductase family protein [Pseudomonas asplenii]|uniref:Amino acid adenylation enzyme/thioester reductase family protein n=1 Tax=Pseudomonas asplenii TaxID=53407 RepID=A0A0N0E388_9PSED|nr:non-ribosomal peptide synthetase [Pseudomonas fuscovaginae]KPA89805.1 amino acid adenylation enzyme/thioester reductase family protein [Pseudomonas fuscovaginae]
MTSADLPMFAPETPAVELTSPQQGIWFDQIANPELPYYNIGMVLEIKGELDLPLFEKAFQLIVDRHESLRLVLSEQGASVRQRVLPHVKAKLSVVEFSGEQAGEEPVKAYLQDVFRQPFTLLGEVLWEARLVRCGADRHYCLYRNHHLVGDGIAVYLIIHAVVDAYNGLLRGDHNPPQGNSYLSFLAEDRAYLESTRFERDKAFWKERYAELPPPFLQPRVAVADNRTAPSALSQMMIPRALFEELGQFARSKGLSLPHIFMSVISTYFCRTTGVDSIVIGMPVHNRTTAYQKNTAGMFSSLNPIRLEVDPQASFLELMQTTSTQLRRSYRYQRFPIAELNRMLKLNQMSRRQLFDVSLSFESLDGEVIFGDSPTKVHSLYSGHERLPLAIFVCDYNPNADVYLDFNFNTAFFTLEEVQQIQTRMLSMLTHVVEQQHTAVSHFPIMPMAERQQVLQTFNATEQLYPDDELIHTRFEQQAERQPDACAVSDHHGKALTYAELNRAANQLAHHLITLGVGPDDRVAICVERGPQMIVGLLGILKAGAGYVPLDPAYPAERLAYLLQDSAPVAVLVHTATAQVLALGSLPVIHLDDAALQAQSVQNPQVPGLDASHLAYVIYTSGSTGLPKGVQVEHRHVARLFSATDGWFGFSPDDVWALFHSFAFDFSVWEIWGALMHGGQLLIVPHLVSRSPRECYALLCDAGVTVLNQTPSAFRQLIAAQADSQQAHALRHVIFGGEALETGILKPWYARPGNAGTQLVNMYGITETTVHVTYYPLQADDVERAGVSPIGQRIPDLQLYVLDARREPMPPGVVGELYVGGAGVARGYLNRPELNEERFLANPFSEQPDARLYRTGDLVRWAADGRLEYMGRNDDQVKIRGFRIELGEIEARLAGYEAVKEAVIMAREDMPGDKRLVAYFTTDAAVSPDLLRQHLQAQLPDHMVPAAYVRLESLPLTSNGKLDRKALPAPTQSSMVNRQYEAPIGDTETAIAAIWQELLDIDQVGRHDHFFELGGHSLVAVKLIEQMRQIGLSADVRVLFSQPTLAALAAAVGGGAEIVVPANRIPEDCKRITPDMLPLANLTQAAIDRIVATVPGGLANVQDIYALAPLQEGILFHHLRGEQGDPYVLKSVFAFEDQARLDAFSQALQQLIQRHDILRTALLWEGLDEPVQVVWRQATLATETLHLDPAQGDISTQLQHRHDPQHYRLDLGQAPLMRLVSAYDTAHQRIVSLLLCHHLVLDHTALAVMRDEIQALMLGKGHDLPASVPYRNYVAQARLGASVEAQEAFFRNMLGDLDEPTLPFNLHDVHGGANAIEEVYHRIDSTLSQRLRRQARLSGVSPASLMHLAWAQVIGRFSGRDDVVFGTVLIGRMSGSAGTDRALGMFINTLPMRIKVGDQGARASVQTTHAQLSALLEHEHASLTLAQRCSGVPGDLPLFNALLNYRHTDGEALSREIGAVWAGIQVLNAEERSNYLLTLNVDDLGEDFILNAQTVVDIGAQRICNYVQTALESLVEALEQVPQAPLHSLSILPVQERHQLVVDFNATAFDYPLEQTLHGLFEAQVERTPQAVAVVHGDIRLSYRELNDRANQLAHHLLDIGVKPDDRVAICAERSESMVIGLLAILKAGGSYVPLDPAYPADRIAYMLQDSTPSAVLAQQTTVSLLSSVAVPVIDVDCQSLQGQSLANPQVPGLTAAHLAYVLYTSGSTGTPKGVMNEHRGVVNRLLWAQDHYAVNETDRVLQKTPFGFDVSVWEFFLPLLAGAQLHMARPGGHQDPAYIAHVIREHGITLMHFVPSMLDVFLEHGDRQGFSELRRVLCSGEALPGHLVRRFKAQYPDIALHNLYGPTEAAIDVTAWDCSGPGTPDSTPIGKPIANTRIYLLDAHQQPVPLGVAGEIYIGGVQVARGYLNRAQLTAERFLSDPFSDDPNARLYKTGDLGRWLADGTVEYLGRNDFQVKIRGLRIELGEIEAHLLACEGVRDVVVIARQDTDGDTYLVGYMVGTHANELSAQALQAHLRRHVPDYMVPRYLIQLEHFPLNANGKLDRKALPEPQEPLGSTDATAPRTALEQALVALWKDNLKREVLGVHDNYFMLGGDSLKVIHLQIKAREQGMPLTLGQIYQNPTIAQLAQLLSTQQASSAQWQPTVHVKPFAQVSEDIRLASEGVFDEVFPASQLQVGMIYHSMMYPDSAIYHDIFRYRLRLRWDATSWNRACDALIRRHPALRMSFDLSHHATPMARVHRAVEPPVQVIDVTALGPAERALAVSSYIEERKRHRPDWHEAPLYQFGVFVAADDINLVFSFHHAILDGWSVATLMRDLITLYTSTPETDPLPALITTPADFIALEQAAVTTAEHRLFWSEYLREAPAASMTSWVHAVAPDPVAHRSAYREMPAADLARLEAFCRAHDLPLRSVLLTAHGFAQAILSNQKEVLCGVISHGRPEFEDAASILGLFLNTLPVRFNTLGQSWLELVRQSIAQEQQVFTHRRYPFALIHRETDVALDVVFNYVDFYVLSDMLAEDDGILIDWETTEASNYDLLTSLGRHPRNGSLMLKMDYRTARVAESQVQAYAEYLLRTLALMMDAPEASPCVPAWSPVLEPTTPAPAIPRPHDNLASLLLDSFARHAPQTAVSFDGTRLSYRQLRDASAQMASWLHRHDIGQGDRVAIMMPRSPELIVALLGVIQAGAAYVPIDLSFPDERIRLILEDSQPSLILFADASQSRVTSLAKHAHQRHWDSVAAEFDNDPGRCAERVAVLAAGIEADDNAYVLYTSGSTGRPKGVAMPHRALTHLILWQNREQAQGIDPTVSLKTLQYSSISFDVSFQEIFSTLSCGAELVMIEEALRYDFIQLLKLICARQINRLFLPYVAFQGLAEVAMQLGIRPVSLRLINVAGEQLKITSEIRDLINGLEGCRVENHYGPTESHVVTRLKLEGASETWPSMPSIGTPIDGVRLHVLDAAGNACPVGVIGELFIEGPCLANGYWNRSDLTDERFVYRQLEGQARRLYETGDIGFYLPWGDLVYQGRGDAQVKIRGYRVELGEIEVAMLGSARFGADIRQVAVIDKPANDGTRYLVGFVQAMPGRVPDLDQLKAEMRLALPDYMVPNTLISIEQLPVGPTGKIDRRQLQKVEIQHILQRPFTAPRNAVEDLLQAYWQEALGLEEISVHDNFFEVGGNSLKAVQLVAKLVTHQGLEPSLADFIQAPTIAEFAQVLQGTATGHPATGALVDFKNAPGQPPVFLVHPIGGHVLCYAALAHVLKDQVNLMALQAPGTWDAREPIPSVYGQATYYADAIEQAVPHGALNIGGWSYGGVVAYELASELQRRGRLVHNVFLLDTIVRINQGQVQVERSEFLNWFMWELLSGDGQKEYDYQALDFSAMSDAQAFAQIRQHGIDQGIFDETITVATLDQLFRVFHANWQGMLDYSFPPRDLPVTLFAADVELPNVLQSPHEMVGTAFNDPYRGWRALSPQVQRIGVEGDHLTMMREPHIQRVGSFIKLHMDAALIGDAGNTAGLTAPSGVNDLLQVKTA